MSLRFVFFTLAALFFAGPAFAADSAAFNAPSAFSKAEPVFPDHPDFVPPDEGPNPYKDVPDAYLNEARAFNARCDSNPTMRQYYNCECLAAKYLDTRISMGKNADSSVIELAISRQCADASGAAGYQYRGCMQNPMMPSDRTGSAEEFCTCYANTYARIYERAKIAPSSKAFVQIRTQSLMACSDPRLANRLFPGLNQKPR